MSTALDFEHRFVPHEAEGGGTTLLLLHGTGGDENDLLQLGSRVLPGAALLSPRGRVLENGMPRFFRRLAEGVFDLDNLLAETAALGKFIETAAEHYDLDPARIVALGFSNGANIAASLLLRQPKRLAAAALLRPMLPFQPSEPVDLHHRPVLIRSGRQDPLVPVGMVEELASVLRTSGADVTLGWSPAGHQLTAGDVEATAAWLQAFANRAAARLQN